MQKHILILLGARVEAIKLFRHDSLALMRAISPRVTLFSAV